MKQKRKVKSLLPYKIDKDGTMLTILLLILSLVLCLGSASLMTVSVGAADDRGNFKMVYPGLDDRVEVLYGLQFSDPNPDKLWNEFVNEFYVDNESLYLTPNQVKVKAKSSTFAQNTVDTEKYINLLGGEANRIYSDNITLIAGNGNEVAGDNDNVSILGGQGNKILGSSSGAPAVIAGGDTNVIENNNSNVIVGGYDNKIVNAENAIILGGESNTVNGGENIIIGGKNVEVNGASNIFAFSNFGSFEPATSDAFYLNLSGGVGVNVDAAVRGLSVKGAVGFGEIDISEECKNENIGVEGYWNVDGYGCLVGCTEKSKNGGNWELLDRGSICEEKCSNNSRCIYEPTDITGNIVSDYTAFCTDHVSTANAERCTTGENESFENVVFETILIGSNEECPVSGHNKCVYRCNPGTDLTGNVGVVASCNKRCELPWDHTQTIPHNATTTGYNTRETACATDSDNNPVPPHTCKNHKKTLICSGGTLYVMNNGRPTNTTAESGGYIYETCMLGGYRCETGANNYNLTIDIIQGRLKDRPNNQRNSRIVSDRTPVNGFRGQYKICIDYNATPPADGKNGENCSTGDITPTPYHYKLIKCQSGYSTGAGYEDVCMKKCTLTDLDGHAREYVHLTVITGYQASGAVCTGTCMSAKIVCNDGRWRLGSETGSETTLYPYNDCILSDKKCSGFPVSQATVNEHGQHSYYGSCDPYKAQGKSQCNKEETEYILTGCHENYHTESGHESRNQWCISNEKIVDCLVGDKDSTKYEYIVTGVTVTWSGGWNRGSWNKAKTCEWKCRDDYHLSGDYNNGGVCVSNKKTVPCKTGWAEEHVNYDVKNVEIRWIGSRNTGYWAEPADCSESGCVAGRCGDACGSETKTTKCSSDPAMPAEYAHEVNTGVELTVSCDENPYCRWSCDTGHHLENGKCEPNARQCEEVGELMEGAYYDHTQNFTYWEGEWDTGHWVTEPCNILCTGGYYPEPVSGVCVKLPGCQGDLNTFRSAVIVVSGADVITDSEWTLYPTMEEAEEHTCSLACDEDHLYINGKCMRCPNGVVSDSCTEEAICEINYDGIIRATEAYLNDYSSINNCNQSGSSGSSSSSTPGLSGISITGISIPGSGSLPGSVGRLGDMSTITCSNINQWKNWFNSKGKQLIYDYSPSKPVSIEDLHETLPGGISLEDWLSGYRPNSDSDVTKLYTLLSGAGTRYLLYPRSNCILGTNGKYECTCVYYGNCLDTNNKTLNLANSEGVIIYGSTYDENRPIDGEDKRWSFKTSVSKLKPNQCTYTCTGGYDKISGRHGCEKIDESLECDYFPYVNGYYKSNRVPINGVTTWTMFNDTSVNYGPYDTGEKLILEDGTYCPTASKGDCYSLTGMGCAWACDPNTTLAKRVTLNSYTSNDDYHYYCRQKCREGMQWYYSNVGTCIYCDDYPQTIADTGFIIGPVNGVGVELTGSETSKGNPVRCVRRCGKYENYNDSSKKCERVYCTGDSYMRFRRSEYSCIICETDKGYELTGWDEEYQVYTGCENKCKFCEQWDNINKECRVVQCGDNEYMNYNGDCVACGESMKPTNERDDYCGNYTYCENKCPNGETYYNGKCLKCPSGERLVNGVCIGASGQMTCPSGYYKKKDANGNFINPIECFTCFEGQTFDETNWECVDD